MNNSTEATHKESLQNKSKTLKKDLLKKARESRISRKIISDSIIAIIIAISPYLLYLYKSLPAASVWETFLFTIESTFYEDVNLYAWLFLGKFIPFLLLVLWFFTCKHWWYHILLIPISMYAFQLFTVLNNEGGYVDELEIYYLIPLMAIIIPFVYLIRIKLFDKLVHGIDLKEIERELDEFKEKEREEKKRKEEERKKNTFL